MPLWGLHPGEYVAQVTIVDELGRKFGFLRTPVILLPLEGKGLATLLPMSGWAPDGTGEAMTHD